MISITAVWKHRDTRPNDIFYMIRQSDGSLRKLWEPDDSALGKVLNAWYASGVEPEMVTVDA